MHDVKERLASSFPAFAGAPGELMDRILSSSSRVSFTEGAFLYSEGDACEGIGFFLSGHVRVYKLSESGREITLYEIYPGETCILNAACILSGGDYPAIAQASSDGEVLLLPAHTFKGLVDAYDEVRAFLFSLFSDRLSTIMELVEEVAFGRMDERITDYLVEKSEDGVLATTHQAIANDLGTSREVVSRLLKDLEGRGAVSLSRNRIAILDL